MFTFRLQMCLFRVKKPMYFVYRVISCDGIGGSIACAWNSQMAPSLSQIRVACSTMTMSSFPPQSVFCIATVSNNTHYLHSATILTHTIACSHIFFSETQYCYSPNDIRSQLVPFSAIPRSGTWKCAKL